MLKHSNLNSLNSFRIDAPNAHEKKRPWSCADHDQHMIFLLNSGERRLSQQCASVEQTPVHQGWKAFGIVMNDECSAFNALRLSEFGRWGLRCGSLKEWLISHWIDLNIQRTGGIYLGNAIPGSSMHQKRISLYFEILQNRLIFSKVNLFLKAFRIHFWLFFWRMSKSMPMCKP